MPKEWSYFPAAPPADAPAASKPPPHPIDESGRAGPIDRSELKSLLRIGAITLDTPFQAPGMAQAVPLGQIRELRWALSKGPGLLSPFEAAGVALGVLRQLAALQPAVDDRGQPLQPPPRAHVALSSPDCLPHIAQVWRATALGARPWGHQRPRRQGQRAARRGCRGAAAPASGPSLAQGTARQRHGPGSASESMPTRRQRPGSP